MVIAQEGTVMNTSILLIAVIFIAFLMLLGLGMAFVALLSSKGGRAVLAFGIGSIFAMLLLMGLFVGVSRVEIRPAPQPPRPAEQAQLEPFKAPPSEAPHVSSPTGRPETVPMPEGLQPLVEVTPEQIKSGGPSSEQPSPEKPLSVRETILGVHLREVDVQPGVASPDSMLPHWAINGNNNLRSDRFATVEEAERQLQIRVLNELRNIYQVQFPEFVQWEPTLPQLKSSGFIRRECVAAYPLTVGEFTETVYEVTWDCQVRDNNAAAQQLANMWRAQVSERRVYYVAFGVLGVTLLLLGSGIALQRGRWTQSTPTA